MISRRIGGSVLGLVLCSLSTAALAQPVLQSVSVQVNPGKMPAYLERVQGLQGVMNRLGGGATVQVWQATLAGTNTGTVLVGISYPSLAAYAETTPKAAVDPEWQKLIAGLDDIRTLSSSSLLESIDGAGPTTPAGQGAVLHAVLVRVEPGHLDEYLGKIEALKKVQERLGMSGSTRVWQFTLAGDATGLIGVGITHASLAAYAADTGKLQADAEGQKLFEGLDDMRTVLSSSLYRNATP